MSIFPKKLRKNDTIALVSPAGAIYETEAIEIAVESLEALGLKVKKGKNLVKKYGYLAGTDAERAEDLHEAFADKDVKAIIAMRGGYGCGRLLDLLDYDLIRKNPKILAGFSDVTALLLAVYAKTKLITFHSPMGTSVWNEFTVTHFRNALFENDLIESNLANSATNSLNKQQIILQNPTSKGENLTQIADRIQIIHNGEAEGIFLGGNLTVFASLIGTPYLPDFENSILFLEEVNEEIYRIDRLFCQLKLSGILSKVKGIVLGKFTNCGHGNRFSSLTLEDVFAHYINTLNIPCFSGAMIGHINNKFTVPVGAKVKIDAAKGSIEML
jgi:muramoyltetrapeptide carboxypeptidase